MTTAAALKAHVTRRLMRAADLGVELTDEEPFDVFADEDFTFDPCPKCRSLMGATHVCSSGVRACREEALDAMTPALQRWGWEWVSFVIGEGQKPKAPKGMEAACRDLELRIAAIGLADPDGLVIGVDNLRGKRRKPRRNTKSGKMPEALRRHLVDQRNHRSGRMY